ncbi:YuiB family protein [Paenibacillus turpanensis]|uniref:YuiB family protein n=1 Tax=Paenibacillus turpanensis TaxID=2689078 RepID=UPI001408743F|nr:YuiB family protein [Paenibacillus turpanensis]
MLQLIIVTVLFFVMAFGLGFILNMLLKTTWFPVYGYVAVIIGLIIYWQMGQGSLLNALSGYTYVDLITGLGGLGGAYLSGWTIQTLRVKGYKMF